MVERADRLDQEDDLPLPGTQEPADGGSKDADDPTEGPGNVSVDEPTDTSLEEGSEGGS